MPACEHASPVQHVSTCWHQPGPEQVSCSARILVSCCAPHPGSLEQGAWQTVVIGGFLKSFVALQISHAEPRQRARIKQYGETHLMMAE